MGDAESTIRGGPGFQTTAWSLIRSARGADAAARREILGRLFALYWRPIYWSLRRDWNEDRESARDLAQEYLAMFLEKDLVDAVSADRGRFRAFVKATLRNFMLQVRRSGRAAKRGGDAVHFPLPPEGIDRLEAARASDPGADFDRELLRAVLEDALAVLGRRYSEEGRDEDFGIFREYYSRGRTYEEVARELGRPVSELGPLLHEARGRYRDLVLERLRDGVSSEEELAAEARELLGD